MIGLIIYYPATRTNQTSMLPKKHNKPLIG